MKTVVTKVVMKHKLCKGKFCYLKKMTRNDKKIYIHTLIKIYQKEI